MNQDKMTQRPLTEDEILEILDTRADDAHRQSKNEIWALVPPECKDELTTTLEANGVTFTSYVPIDSKTNLFKINCQS